MMVPILIVVWLVVLLPPLLRNHREGRPGDSVLSFRRTLSTLERARPGAMQRAGYAAVRPVGGMTRSEARKRRRDVLFGLGGATGVSLLLAIGLGGIAVLMFACCAVLLAGYTMMLIQVQKQAVEREAKVRVLVPQAARTGRQEPAFALRRS
ncbi:MAG: hypothetical protein JWM05_2519, partial [Acidimicrobiales bacterium]|nr:hypothetical protein [Acidimicrobiales bacterium]